ncbi:monovalent cation/H(+) antiporter subunit G [Cumulibacter manganitolerans]|uniref:monovalent cation/H(+) antiporter subunit G n=1 Tax=Cumulibacter manganitolerans TaxID=1884992 RepID=UPI001297268F|nr:monovalent cation/H(+) antiporter subunit G [Cumulibacter manganitolerans]
MSWATTLDVAGAVAILCGALLTLIAAIGLVRFESLYLRMHAATKPQTLGLLLILVGLALTLRTWNALGTLLLVAIAQALTAPVSAHMLSRAAYRAGLVHREQFDFDELADALERAERDAGTAESPRRGGAPREGPPGDATDPERD